MKIELTKEEKKILLDKYMKKMKKTARYMKKTIGLDSTDFDMYFQGMRNCLAILNNYFKLKLKFNEKDYKKFANDCMFIIHGIKNYGENNKERTGFFW